MVDESIIIKQKERVDKEMAAMQASKSEMIATSKVAKTAANQKSDNAEAVVENTVKLEDFKIKKLIDKGSFGKVYLVVNTKDGKEYAMKRINKDILIEKG